MQTDTLKWLSCFPSLRLQVPLETLFLPELKHMNRHFVLKQCVRGGMIQGIVLKIQTVLTWPLLCNISKGQKVQLKLYPLLLVCNKLGTCVWLFREGTVKHLSPDDNAPLLTGIAHQECQYGSCETSGLLETAMGHCTVCTYNAPLYKASWTVLLPCASWGRICTVGVSHVFPTLIKRLSAMFLYLPSPPAKPGRITWSDHPLWHTFSSWQDNASSRVLQ